MFPAFFILQHRYSYICSTFQKFMTQSDCFILGYIARRVGNFGELSFLLDVDDPGRYAKLSSVFVEINKSLVPFFVKKIQLRGSTATVLLDGVDSIEKADKLVKSSLYLPLSSLPALSGKRFYFHEVKGFTVVDTHAGTLGTIAEVLDFPQQAILRILQNDTEILVPAREEFIVRIDRANKVFEVQTPEGLLDIYLGSREDSDDDKETDEDPPLADSGK